ncbi:MAG: tRNA lysidine(34) synthetase TilS [Planktotalea sp.]|uniref:tRNA lysidine(34) synthetase TilS n=1 Tax=Planktotalea sp. TaxID=2029877 RepID=UPI003C7798F1
MLNENLLNGQAPLGIALSGGSDSTALLVLAAQALGGSQLRAVTVNHGLRTEAQAEALAAGKTCAALGVAHDIVALDLDAGSDLQARARTARYNALAAWAKRNNIAAIALGHTEDDVAETFLMRLARGSGVDGLAQMPARFERGGVTFLRPLLGARRSGLQSLLRERSIAWSEDPSNTDTRYTRVKMRRATPELAKLGLTSERLSQTAKWMRAASEVLEQAAENWIAQHARADHGDAVFDRDALRAAPDETASRVLSRALCNISGNPYRPRLNALQSALHSDAAMTVHGCLIYPHATHLRVTREYNAITCEERRWKVSGGNLDSYRLAPLGETGLNQIKNWRETALLPRRSLLSSPAIWDGGQVIAAPLAKPDGIWSAVASDPLHFAK